MTSIGLCPRPFAARTTADAPRLVMLQATQKAHTATGGKEQPGTTARLVGLVSSAALLLSSPFPAMADSNIRLPPLDNDPNRCERAYVGNTIGQANAVSDKILDLRFCDYSGKDLSAKTLSGALLADANLSKSNMQEVVMSKAYAVGANLSGADMTNAVVDRVVFDKANLSGAKFVNAVITGTTFEGADLTNTVFEDALIGSEDAKRLCSNPTLTGESRSQVGCRGKDNMDSILLFELASNNKA